jgi:hypothetical protein
MPTVTAVSASPDLRLELESSRARQTARPPRPFRDFLAGGVDLLMAGAEVATQVTAGPILAATVHDARAATSVALGRPFAGASLTAEPGAGGSTSTAAGVAPTALLQAGQPEGQLSSAQLLVLQQQIQQESQQFSTLSNVMRAKHDTAKAAVSNIRA